MVSRDETLRYTALFLRVLLGYRAGSSWGLSSSTIFGTTIGTISIFLDAGEMGQYCPGSVRSAGCMIHCYVGGKVGPRLQHGEGIM